MADSPVPTQGQQVNPSSLSVEDISRAAQRRRRQARSRPSRCRRTSTPARRSGADGRINLVHYAAWLVREVQAR